MTPVCRSFVSDLRDTRLEKAQSLQELDQGPYALHFRPSHRMATLQSDHADLPNGEERDVVVSVAGRVMTRRVMGKLAFFTLADETGTMQLFLEKAGLEAQQEGWCTTFDCTGDVPFDEIAGTVHALWKQHGKLEAMQQAVKGKYHAEGAFNVLNAIAEVIQP